VFSLLHYHIIFLVPNSNFTKQKSIREYMWTYLVYNYICLYTFIYVYIIVYYILYNKIFEKKVSYKNCKVSINASNDNMTLNASIKELSKSVLKFYIEVLIFYSMFLQ